MFLRAYSGTDLGLHRSNNEDFRLVDEDLKLFVVCDGMGGHRHGEVASKTAAETVHRFLSERHAQVADFDNSPDQRKIVTGLVTRAINQACQDVFEISSTRQGHGGMGTTLTMLWVLGQTAALGQVGDSRLYVLRDGRFVQLSEDHSMFAEMVGGGMDPALARKSPMANKLTRALGLEPQVEVDTMLFDIRAGDRLLLCSDGVTAYFPDDEKLGEVIAAKELADVPAEVIRLAREAGGRDNITLIVIEALEEDATTAAGHDAPTAELPAPKLQLRLAFFRKSLAEIANWMREHTERSFNIAPGIDAEQTTLTLVSREAVDVEGAVEALDLALGMQGLQLSPGDDGFEIQRTEAEPAAARPAKEAFEAPTEPAFEATRPTFLQARLTEVVEWMSAHTARRFSIDEPLRESGKRITLVSPKPLTPEEALSAFDTALELNGLSAVEQGDGYVIRELPADATDPTDPDIRADASERRRSATKGESFDVPTAPWDQQQLQSSSVPLERLAFAEADLVEVADWMSRYTGKTIVVEESLRAQNKRISLRSPREMTPEEAYGGFLVVVTMHDLAVVESPQQVLIRAGSRPAAPTRPKA